MLNSPFLLFRRLKYAGLMNTMLHGKRNERNRTVFGHLLLNRDEYRQILLLFLDTSDKQHVLDVIDVLNENPIVRSAQVDLLGVQEFYEGWDTVLTGYVRDGFEISPADALYVLQYTVGKVRLNAMQLVAADVDMDGKVTAADALHILQYLVGQNDLCEKIVKWTDDAF